MLRKSSPIFLTSYFCKICLILIVLVKLIIFQKKKQEELGCVDDKYCEAISSTSVILSRIVVKIIEASEKSIEYLKSIKHHASSTASANGHANHNGNHHQHHNNNNNNLTGANTNNNIDSDESSWFSQHTATSMPHSVNTADGFLSHSSGHSSTATSASNPKSNFIKLTSEKLKRNTKLSKAVDNIYKRKTTKIKNDFDPMGGANGNENVFVDTHNFGQRIDCEDYEDYDEEGDEDEEEEGEYVDQTMNGVGGGESFFQNEDDDEDDYEEDANGTGCDGLDANGMFSSNHARANNMESRIKLISLIGRDGNKFKSSYLIKKSTINNNRIKGNRKMYFCPLYSFKTVYVNMF